MGKKNKSDIKTIDVKTLKKFGQDNKIMLAVLGGAAAGIAIAALFGTEKAKRLLDTVENDIKDFSSKAVDGLHQPGTV